MIRMAKVRKELDLSQMDIVRKTGLHTTTVSGIENQHSKPWPRQRERIEAAMKEAGWNGEGDLFEEVTCDG